MMNSMGRFLLIAWFALVGISPSLIAQPRIKGKKFDTTQAVFGDDTTVKKLIEFKDSMAAVGPKTEGPREATESDPTGMIILILGSLIVIIWAGRRAWLRRRNA